MQSKWLKKSFSLAIIILSLLLSACVQTALQKQESVMIVWKSPSFRYADMGFTADSGSVLKIEIYGSGSALMRLSIGRDSICTNRFSCMPKSQFNKRFLSGSYPDDTLENIFRGKSIFGGKSMVRKRNGFTQKIQKSTLYNINYSVLNNKTIFRDTINQIVIKVSRQ